MHILLLILKIIGISLLVILGILILLIGMVLFVPVRYKVDGDIRRTTKEKVAIHGKVTWFCSAVRYVFSYENNHFQGELLIFGRKRKEKSPITLEELMEEEDEQADSDSSEAEQTEGKDSEGEQTETENSKEEQRKQADLKAVRKTKENIFQKISNKIRNTVQRITSFIKNIKEKLVMLKALLTDEVNKRVCKKIFAELIKLLKHLRFRKLHTDLKYGFTDPSITGQSFGVVCLIPVLYQYNVVITPDFETESTYIEGTFDAKGYLCICHGVMMLIRLLLEKEVRMKLGQLMHNMNK